MEALGAQGDGVRLLGDADRQPGDADVDGDGDLDLICGNDGNRNALYENVGGTLSVEPRWFFGLSNSTRSIALGDVDGDGFDDVNHEYCADHGKTLPVTLPPNASTRLAAFKKSAWKNPLASAAFAMLGEGDAVGLDLAAELVTRADRPVPRSSRAT